MKRLSDEEIISALLEQGSIKGAAALLGCTVRTLYQRMKKTKFKELYQSARDEIIRSTTAKLQGYMTGAVDTLADIMKDEEVAKQTRVNSAVSILQYGARFTEVTDVINRLDAIEELQRAMEQNNG